MNAERLHAILIELNAEMQSSRVTHAMSQLIGALKSVITTSNAASQQELAKYIKQMYDAITDPPSDKFSPTWRQILIEIGGEDLFGYRLKTAIEDIIARNQITLAVALDELTQLQKGLTEFEVALKGCIEGLQYFEIGHETLAPGHCEIGILIPRKAVNNQLDGLAKELQEERFILDAFNEVATGKKQELLIKSISSSEILIFLEAAAPYAACVAFAIERLVSLYKQLLEIRKLHQDLRKQGVPESQITGVTDHANSLMEKGIKELAKDIMDKYHHKKDVGRRNELENMMCISLNRLANRIDRGFNIEVRVEPISADAEESKENKSIQDHIEQIQHATKDMQYLKLEGQPILRLQEKVSEKKVTTKSETKKTAPGKRKVSAKTAKIEKAPDKIE